MKKLVSLLLVGCMLLGLAACGNAQKESSMQDTSAPKSSASETSTVSSVAEEVDAKPFEGTEIEVWGFAVDSLDVEKADVNYSGIVKGAMAEWCLENGVTLKFSGAYNQNALMAAVASGASPDLIVHYNIFPLIANLGLAMPLTDECYKELCEITGTSAYCDAWSWKGKSYGLVYPMQGRDMCHYNRTIFDEYGVKTPLEYWKEGNWTWDTMVECMKAVTKDLDGDGTFDTYGMRAGAVSTMVKMYEEGPDGKLSSLIDTEEYRRYADIIYNGVLEGWLVNTSDKITAKFDNPRPVMEFTNVAVYEHRNLFKYQSKDECYYEAVPMPGMTHEEATYKLGNYGMAKCAATDNEEAVEALMCHVFKVMMKGISDISLGTVSCEYEFLKGTTPFTEAVLEKWGPYLEKQEAAKDYPNYDEEHYAEMQQFIKETEPIGASKKYAGVSVDLKTLIEQPPATSIATLIETVKTQIDTYNSLYVY